MSVRESSELLLRFLFKQLNGWKTKNLFSRLNSCLWMSLLSAHPQGSDMLRSVSPHWRCDCHYPLMLHVLLDGDGLYRASHKDLMPGLWSGCARVKANNSLSSLLSAPCSSSPQRMGSGCGKQKCPLPLISMPLVWAASVEQNTTMIHLQQMALSRPCLMSWDVMRIHSAKFSQGWFTRPCNLQSNLQNL